MNFRFGSTRTLRAFGASAAALLLLAALAFTGTAHASSIEEDDDDVSGADRAFGPPPALLDSARRRAAETGFGWIAGVSAYVANDDNVFRSPATQERTSSAWGNAGYLRGDARFGGSNRSLTTVTWNQTKFDAFRQIDSTHPHLSQWFQHRFSPSTALELDLDVVHQNDDATTITGFAYTRDYSWWRYGGEAVLEYAPGERHRFRAGVEEVRKDYGEVASLNSIDWSHWRASGSYRFRIGPGHYAGIKFERGHRVYDAEPASLADGNEQPGNPVEKHAYRDLVLWYGAPLGSKLELDASMDLGHKTDEFQGYENYDDRTIRLGLLARPASGLELRAGLVSGHRDYDRILADGGAMLAYDTVEARFGARVRVLGTWWVYGDVNSYQRDTNRSSGLDYRDYRGVFTRAGVSVFH
ncbi:MAG: hypothetical protein IPJ04_14615 [Candidatus Eisenbacteria bacterium]|nr:hypothetical protein [Candidatus Eisenbacteria bacterium]